jgi:hypothetical protein
MARLPIINNLRIVPRDADFLDRKTGERGEIFYDQTNNTLRVFDAQVVGGISLVKRDLSNVSNADFLAKATLAGVGGGAGSIEVSDTAPSSPDEGTIWFNSANAKIYVYVNDGTSSQWIQPVAPVPGSILDLGISDGTVGQILTTDGAGGFTFEDAPQGFDGEWSSLSNTPTTLAGYGITDAFDGAFSSLTGKPTTLAGYGITDAFDGAFSSLTGTPTTVSGYGITDAQALLVSGTNIKTVNGTSLLGSGDVTISASTGNVTFTGYTIDTSDSTAISITPAVAMDSDLAVGNDLTVGQDLTVANNLIVQGSFSSEGSGTPEIFSDNEIQLTAGTRVELTSSPIKMASFSTAERDNLIAENGDIIYNSSTNKFQGYENGSWVNLI